MKIAVAQATFLKGDVDSNITIHQNHIALAVEHRADAIFFPELSITGYEPQLAEQLAFDKEDKKLDPFETTSNRNNIAIGIGVPKKAAGGIHISMIVFQPQKQRQLYSKQQLHVDEMPFFVPGQGQLTLNVKDKSIAPAICYESLQPAHAANAKKLGADIYVACVAKSQAGVDKAMKHYPAIAKQFAMPVLMSNCIGYYDNFVGAGQSAVWTKNGILAAQLQVDVEGILVFNTETEEVVKAIFSKK